MSSGNIAILTLTVVSAGALAANRFLTQAGTYPAAGGPVLGVTRSSAAGANESMPVDVQGTTVVECGAAITKDAALTTDAQGRVVPLAGSGKIPVGKALEAGLAVGSFIEILLVPTLVPTP
jgi:hypothetical protein